jgi:AcrR family transcriptional regulator
MKPPSSVRERILFEATRLFAERSYERTSVADVQEAAGLTRGSGALYKHFLSKEALLTEIVERFVVQAQAGQTTLRDLTSASDVNLSWIVGNTLEKLALNRDALRIFWRDLDPFPALKAKVQKDVTQSTYLVMADWLAERQRRGELRAHDAEAVAAIVIGSITMFRVFEALWGERAIPVSDQRFADAWRDVLSHALRRKA